jgi:hypothetical protein
VLGSSATNDPRWQSLSSDIQALLSKVQLGHDLTAHLSLEHRHGITPAASATGPDVNRWADKDMLLNVMGYHHFHFDAVPHNRMRSDDVLFAHVTRDTFTVIGIFDHTVFKVSDPAKPMTAERSRLWELFEERATRGAPGEIVVLSMNPQSGHRIDCVNFAKKYARAIRETDPKLNDPVFVRRLYQQAGLSVPAKPKLRWHLQYLDLGVLDKENRGFSSFPWGPN